MSRAIVIRTARSIALAAFLSTAAGSGAAFPVLAAAQQPAETTEIAVSADAEAVLSPSTAEIVLLLQGTGSTATEAYGAVEAISKQLQNALAPKKARVTLRGHHFQSGSQGNSILTKNAPVRVERQLVVSTEQLSDVPNLVDASLSNGASSVLDVRYRAPSAKELEDAIRQAIESAKRKAELVAGTLGVKLGPVISSVVTEEPAGASIRRAMQEGGQLVSNEERRTLVVVSVRYGIQRGG